MGYEIKLELPAGDQSELEYEFGNFMINQVEEGKLVLTKDNYWGESYVLQGNDLHCIQWQFIVEEIYNDDDEVIGVYFEDDIYDFEVQCSWLEFKDYKKA